METTNRFFSGFAATRARLAMLAATFLAAMVGVVTPAYATLTNITLGAPSGTLTAGTPGSITYLVTVTKNTQNNNSSAALSITWTGAAPTGVTTSFSPTSVSWSGSGAGGSGPRTSTLTITTTAATPALTQTFTVGAQRNAGDVVTVVGTLTVALPTPTITFGAAPTPTYQGGNFTVSATTNSDGALSYSFVSGPCTQVSAGTFSSSGAGTCVVQANTAATTTWAAGSAQQSVSIAQASQTITFGTLGNKTVGDADFSVSATGGASGNPVIFTASGPCSVTGTLVSLAGSGSCSITAAQAGNTDFLAAANVTQSFVILPNSPYAAFDLYAVAGSTTLAGQPTTVWGYNDSAATATQPGGPTLVVNEGDVVVVNLHNNLVEPTAILFQGQAMAPDTTGAAAGATKSYIFTASQPGTYLYEAGLLLNAQHQVAMGLHGALVVRPAVANQAYADIAATTTVDEGLLTAYDAEAVLVLSEIDPALNNAANPATFDMRNFAPRYFTINGQVHPDTAAIAAVPGNKVLLRYVNAGVQHHSMAVLGLRQNFVAKDASLLPTGAQSVSAETLAAGQTGDAIATVPLTAADGSKFAVYDGSLKLYNNGDGSTFGGMLTFITAAGTPGPDTTGPRTSNLAYSAGTLTATVSDTTTGGASIAAAEYYLDSTAGTGTAMSAADGTFDAITEDVTAAVAVAAGAHTLFVRGRDSLGNWGAFSALAVSGGDATGPTTSALVLTPSSSNGTVAVALSGTANDTASGGSNIAAAEYTIDGGTAAPMAVSPVGAKIASVTATISAATINTLAEGSHPVAVRSQDTAGNWGTPATINLLVNKTGPATSNVVAAPNPNNGTVPLSASQPVVRVTATMTGGAGSTVAGAEGFIDTVGANGSGFPFVPADGQWNGASETGYADIPLTTIASLSSGNHTITVRGRDAAGNWGATSSTILVIDKTAPTVTGATLTPGTIALGTASVTLNVTASDASGIVGGQYWIDGSATPPATPTAFTGNSVVVNTSALAAGTHTVYVRVQDGASNWSAVSSATIYVVQAVADAKSFNANGTNGTQTQSYNTTGSSLLANDFPTNGTAQLVSAPIRIAGGGTVIPTLSCPGGGGNTAATPSVGGSTICTNGRFNVNLPDPGGNNNAQMAGRRGTYTFTYTNTFNGVTSAPATVTITVN